MAVPAVRCFSQAGAQLKPLVLQELERSCGELRPRRIVLKPNWVLHETDPDFPIRALITEARVIEAAAEACLALFPSAESILVGDCPLQSADWPLLRRQAGLDPVIDRLDRVSRGKVQFRDLRREVFRKVDGGFLEAVPGDHADPRGYRLVSLGARSHLEPIASQSGKFGVNDYAASSTVSNHGPGLHNYLVSQSVLDADLVINLAKWKCHCKSGLTGALKNLVGINGDKAFLPHFRRGAPKWQGDEYPDENRWLYWLQTNLREKLQKRSRWLFRALRPGWLAVKRLRGIETRLERPESRPASFYVAGGGWHGNDTIWRMIYDLNLILQCADAGGQLRDQPQRHYFCIVDGLVSGEGNGPLQPLPRETDWLFFGDDPFATDAVLSEFMGFSGQKIPILSRRREYLGPEWGRFAASRLEIEIDGKPAVLEDAEVNLRFAPPPGWRGHIER